MRSPAPVRSAIGLQDAQRNELAQAGALQTQQLRRALEVQIGRPIRQQHSNLGGIDGNHFAPLARERPQSESRQVGVVHQAFEQAAAHTRFAGEFGEPLARMVLQGFGSESTVPPTKLSAPVFE